MNKWDGFIWGFLSGAVVGTLALYGLTALFSLPH